MALRSRIGRTATVADTQSPHSDVFFSRRFAYFAGEDYPGKFEVKNPMKIPGLRSPYEEVGGIVYFGRMIDKIRLKARGELPLDYNTGTREWYDYDSRCSRFLQVKYTALRKQTLKGGTDLQVLRWCFKTGRRPTREEIEIWNTFMRKRGWKDSSTAGLEDAKRDAGLISRADIVTWFELFDAEEGREKHK